jgi:hypothetical protein
MASAAKLGAIVLGVLGAHVCPALGRRAGDVGDWPMAAKNYANWRYSGLTKSTSPTSGR